MERNIISNLLTTKKDKIFSFCEKNDESKDKSNIQFNSEMSLCKINSNQEKEVNEKNIDKISNNTRFSVITPSETSNYDYRNPLRSPKKKKDEYELRPNKFISLEKKNNLKKMASNKNLNNINLSSLEQLNSVVEISDNFNKDTNTNLGEINGVEPNLELIESLLKSKKDSVISKKSSASRKMKSTHIDVINLNKKKRNTLINNLMHFNDQKIGINSPFEQSDSLVSYKNLVLQNQLNNHNESSGNNIINLLPTKNGTINDIWRRSVTMKNDLLFNAKGSDLTAAYKKYNNGILTKTIIDNKLGKNLGFKNSIKNLIATNFRESTKNYRKSVFRNFSLQLMNKLNYDKYISAMTNYKKRRLLLSDKHINDNKKEQLKLLKEIPNSPFYESSESLLKKTKFCFFVLSLFSLLSIIFSYIDVNLYNQKSWELVLHNNNKSTKNYGRDFSIRNISEYKIIQNRIITNKENTIRVFLAIFNIICGLLIILVNFLIKKLKHESNILKTKNAATLSTNIHNSNLNLNYSTDKIKTGKAKNKIKDEIFNKKSLKNKRLKNSESTIKYLKNMGILEEETSLSENLKLKFLIPIIIESILNMLFLPPSVNKIFIGFERNVIYIYTINNIFMLINFIKIINIYLATYYISFYNGMLPKMICHSNMISHSLHFSIKMIMAKHPFSFLIINWIILTICISYIIYGIEYLSIDIVNGNYSKKGENDFKNAINSFYLYSFLVLRVVFGDNVTRTILGKMILFFGGIIGSIIEGFLFYYLLRLVELNKDEDRAYSKLQKLFDPINKENKAVNFIKTVLMIKKHIKENKENIDIYRQKVNNEKRESIIRKSTNFNENEKNNDKSNNFENILEKTKIINDDGGVSNKDNNKINAIRRKKFIKYLEHIFILKIRFQCDYKNFIDNYKVCRSLTMSFIDAIKSLEEKLIGNNDYLSTILDKIINVDDELIELINANKNASIDLQKLEYYGEQVENVLYEILNESSEKFIMRKQKRIERAEKGLDDSRDRIRKGFNFFFNDSGYIKRNNTNLPNTSKKNNDGRNKSTGKVGNIPRSHVSSFLIGVKKSSDALKFNGLLNKKL